MLDTLAHCIQTPSCSFCQVNEDIGATHKWVVNGNRYPLPGDVEVIGLNEFPGISKVNPVCTSGSNEPGHSGFVNPTL
jgi:hypothetical protein